MGFFNAEKCDWCGKKVKQGDFASVLSFATKGGKHFCSKKCEMNYKASKSGASVSSEGNTIVVNKGSGLGSKMMDLMKDSMKAENNPALMQNKEKQNKISEISSITFTDDPTEIQNTLSQLVTMANNAKGGGITPIGMTSNKQIRSAIKDKMEFGIMKLQSAGKTAEASFFQKKKDAIK